jgi:hypothetical protein
MEEKTVPTTTLEALRPPDRLGAGRVVHGEYVPSNVADLVHCLNIWLGQELAREPKRVTVIRRIKREITWLVNRCDRAIKMLVNA